MDSPKRGSTPSSSTPDPKRLKLTVPAQLQTQGATAVDPENAPGKKSELEPVQGGELGNLENVLDNTVEDENFNRVQN